MTKKPGWSHQFNLFLLLAIAYGFLAYLVSSRRLAGLDLDVTRALQTVSLLPLDYASSIISLLGAAEVTVPMAVVVAFFIYRQGRPWTALALLILLTLVPLVVLFKTLIAQPGPGNYVLHRYTFDFLFPTADLSSLVFAFPSGHVTRITFLLGYAGLLTWRGPSSSFSKYVWSIILVLVASLVGFTRVYSGEHWFSDVVGGYLLGGLALLVAVWLVNRDTV